MAVKMKKLLFLFCILLGLVSCGTKTESPTEKTPIEETGKTESPVETPTEQPVDDGVNYFISTTGKPLLCAHRGGSYSNPENTLKAFKYAVLECQADILESDLWLTKDGHLVLLHDGTLDRTSDAVEYFKGSSLTPGSYSLAELKELNFGAKFTATNGTKPYANILKDIIDKEQRKQIVAENDLSIITIEELLDYFYADYKNLLFVFEIKNTGAKGNEAADALAKVLAKYPDYARRVCVGTFNDQVEAYLKSKYPHIITGASTAKANTFVKDVLLNNSVKESYEFDCLQIPITYTFNGSNVDLVNKVLIDAAHSKNISVQYWTINDRATMQKLVTSNCDVIMTDYPDILREILNASN